MGVLTRLKTWGVETLTHTDLNAEFGNIYLHGRDLVSPLDGSLDMDAHEFILDADADTSITADTDDQIDFRLGGTDALRLTASTSTPILNGVGGFKIQANGSDAVVLTAAGIMTKPTQPLFLATDGAVSNVTGDATVYNPVLFTEVIDRGGVYASGVFTAPVQGLYLLCAGSSIEGLLSGHNSANIAIETSNRVYNKAIYAVAAGANIFTAISGDIAVVADMDAADTAVVKITVSGSTKVVDLTGGAYGYFSGCLLA